MQKHPFPGKLEKNLLPTVAKQGSAEIWNGLLDKAGAIHKRPGLFFNQRLTPTAGGVQALYYWPAKDKVVAVAGGRIYAASSPAATFVPVSDTTAVLVAGPVKIVDTGYWLYFCGLSGPILIWNGVDQAVLEPDGAAPTNVSALATMNQRVIANQKGTNRFWFTSPPDLDDPYKAPIWEGYLEVGRTSEDIVGLEVANNELIVFKRESLQAFYDDGSTPYKPILASQQFSGLISSSAIARLTNTIFFVGPDRIIRSLLNREVRDISTGAVQRDLAQLTDAGAVVVIPLDNLILFTFYRNNLTLVYDPSLDSWTRFSTFYSGLDKNFYANCSTTLTAAGQTNLWLLGCEDGTINYWDSSAFSDVDRPINFLVRTQHQDWDTLNRKTSTRLVAKVSLEAPRIMEIPELNLPPATRCVLYNETIVLPKDMKALISGLPSGLSISQVEDELLITGTVSDFAGDLPIQILYTDAKGAKFSTSSVFHVNDYDITIGVL